MVRVLFRIGVVFRVWAWVWVWVWVWVWLNNSSLEIIDIHNY